MYELLVKSGLSLDAADVFEKLMLQCVEKNISYFDGKVPNSLLMGGPLKRLCLLLSSSRSSPAFLSFASQHLPTPRFSSRPPPPSRISWLTLPYLGHISDSLVRELRKYGYRIGFYPVTKASNLSLLKDVIPKMKKPGVYQIKCSCSDCYIGQSGRTFSKRFAEHERIFQKLANSLPTDSSSAVARHCHETGHPFDQVSLSPLYYCDHGPRLDRLEEYLIRQFQQSSFEILNDIDSVFFNHFLRFTRLFSRYAVCNRFMSFFYLFLHRFLIVQYT